MISTLRTLLLFYRRHLRVQPLRELMAVLGVGAGVALLFAVQVAQSGITGAFDQVTRGVAGRASIELAARGPEGFSVRSAQALARMHGVRAYAPLLTLQAQALGPGGATGAQRPQAITLVGATEQVSALHGRLSTAFERAEQHAKAGFLILTSSLAQRLGVRAGENVTVLIDGRREEIAIAGTLGTRALGSAAGAAIAAAPLPIIQAAAGLPGRVSRALIEPQRGQGAKVRAELERRFGARLEVRPVSAEGTLLARAASAESEVSLLFSVISLLAGVILAYNALLLASGQRRRFIAYLIEAGTPDSIVVASLIFDALILGLAGCAIGLAGGEAISVVAYRGAPGYLTAAFPVSAQHIVSAQSILIAIGSGIAAAFAAAVLPAIGALRGGVLAVPDAIGGSLSLTGSLRASERLLLGGGLLLSGGAVLLASLAPSSTIAALLALVLGIMLCLPMLARGLLLLAGRAARRASDAAAKLAVAELASTPTRPVALLATGVIAAFLMVVIGGSVADVKSAVRSGAASLITGDSLWVRPGGAQNVYTTQPFASAAVAARLERLPLVASVQPWRDAFLDLERRRVWVLGVPSGESEQIVPSELLEGSLAVADARIRAGGWAALSETIVREEHLHLGEAFRLPTPTGEAHLRLAATISNYGWLSGAVVMSAGEEARLWGSPEASELQVRLRRGVPAAAAKPAIAALLRGDGALSVQTSAERRAEAGAVLGGTLSRLNDTTIVVLITAIASVLTLMLSAVWQSRARIDSLISIGMSFTQLLRLIFYECAGALLTGCALGIGVGLLGQYLIDGWLAQSTGSPVRYAPAWQLSLSTLAIAAAIALAGAAIGTARAASTQPRTAFAT